MLKILIIDDDPIVRATLKRTLQNQGYETTVASNGQEGIIQAKTLHPALIICDWVMSEIDGLEVCRQVKRDPDLATTFFILLTAKGAAPGEEGERVQGLDAGADEFVSKPIEMNELKARVRAGLRLHQLSQDLKNKQLALEESNRNLEAELAEAADYVRSLLPSPLVGAVTTEALFVPSAQLGGDCFDYYWIDHDHLVIYLLDVSGHGVGSALLSMSVLNVLRSQSLPNTNFCHPSEVLKALNHTFQMSSHGNKYFTIWYGVYHRSQQRLTYANAGHPPGVLLNKDATDIKQLSSLDLPIGFIPNINFEMVTLEIPANTTLYLFSDGAYEVMQPNGQIWDFNGFFDLLINCSHKNNCNLQEILRLIKNSNANATFDDDLSLIKITFN
ncbi:PP2C family protein-serine/threonine phosphatase [Nodularia sp. UHCC 0506]|uniref:PP2C family protein-serine/threonine phosphatase n=1 Tax=Nodularia sp. UHCC 0506 TaxID=3110243 RepID=UPI002B1FC579|nr:SpoIIE family protein phosphatase [Nodularia sp. UHCC 0506]MEA5515131.1 SpoIIE family protein phosphatase [Nodularia sp. UHCC 0506]